MFSRILGTFGTVDPDISGQKDSFGFFFDFLYHGILLGRSKNGVFRFFFKAATCGPYGARKPAKPV